MTKIFVPFPEKDYINFYIESGINGFIIGIKDYSMNFNNLVESFNLKKVINYLKKKKIDIYISLNKNYHEREIKSLKELLKKISSYKITGLMFNDISVYNIVKENNLNIDLIWNSSHSVTNYKTINFWAQRNVKGTVLSSEININEIVDIRKETELKVGIKLYGYLNMVTSSRSLLTNFFKYINKPMKKNSYKMQYNEEDYPIIEENGETNIFYSKVLNGIEYFPKLIKNNIDFIILDDYLMKNNFFYNVIDAFSALTRAPFDKKFVKKLKDVVDANTEDKTFSGFLNKKTIYKVKKNG